MNGQFYTCSPTEGGWRPAEGAGMDELTCLGEDAEEKQEHRRSRHPQSHWKVHHLQPAGFWCQWCSCSARWRRGSKVDAPHTVTFDNNHQTYFSVVQRWVAPRGALEGWRAGSGVVWFLRHTASTIGRWSRVEMDVTPTLTLSGSHSIYTQFHPLETTTTLKHLKQGRSLEYGWPGFSGARITQPHKKCLESKSVIFCKKIQEKLNYKKLTVGNKKQGKFSQEHFNHFKKICRKCKIFSLKYNINIF